MPEYRTVLSGPTNKAGGSSADLYFADALTISRAPDRGRRASVRCDIDRSPLAPAYR
jgi:hypothetical protein